MKISPISQAGAVVGAVAAAGEATPTMVQKLRSLKMNTNATPGQVEEPNPAIEPLSIPDVSDETQVPAEATQPLSPQLAAIAKAKRALQVKEREIAEREKALETQAPAQGDVVTKAQLISNPLGTLLDAGVTYDQLTEAVLASQDGSNPKIKALEDELKALRGDFDKKLTDRDSQAEDAALNEMEREAKQLIIQGDDYELVRETGSIRDVRELIKRTYKTTGEVLDVREALKLVEDELFSESLKLAKLKKIQSQFAPALPVAQPQQQQRQMRTLTNRDTASVPLSRKARALAAFSGTLKK